MKNDKNSYPYDLNLFCETLSNNSKDNTAVLKKEYIHLFMKKLIWLSSFVKAVSDNQIIITLVNTNSFYMIKKFSTIAILIRFNCSDSEYINYGYWRLFNDIEEYQISLDEQHCSYVINDDTMANLRHAYFLKFERSKFTENKIKKAFDFDRCALFNARYSLKDIGLYIKNFLLNEIDVLNKYWNYNLN